ncbi:hypothetical protein Q1695_011103 [Nippostrongylus brasiliensis]|nr:hypothetical protein Q1695_011103 [Nippostrongylus brasiliensis]
MSTTVISFSLVLLIAYRSVSSLNPCMIDPSACLPLEDFEVNCTCILIHGEPINATDDVYMYFVGHQFPLYLFRQVKMPDTFREMLNIRIPAAHDFQSSLDMPETIYKNLNFEEDMALFLVNSTMNAEILRMLINESYIRTPELRNNSDKWCAEGVYAQVADLLHIIEMGGRSVIAVSTVRAEFSVPKVQRMICENKCKRFYWNEGVFCRQKCEQGLRYDQVAVVGTMKREFSNFVRASAVQNFRSKYTKYISNFRRFPRF